MGRRYGFITLDYQPWAPTMRQQLQALSFPKTVSKAAFVRYQGFGYWCGGRRSRRRTAACAWPCSRSLGEVDALLLADGGYAPANPPAWIEKLRPGVALLSVDASDRRGLPDAETLQALEGYTLLCTDRNGWIEITTDGERMWVEVERK